MRIIYQTTVVTVNGPGHAVVEALTKAATHLNLQPQAWSDADREVDAAGVLVYPPVRGRGDEVHYRIALFEEDE